MKLLNAIYKILNKPFPEQESRFGLVKITAIISLFVTFFLYVFQPFGISTLKSDKFLICLGFGGMTFIAAVIFEFIVGRVFKLKGKLENWTFGKWILYNLGVMLTISLANFLFARIILFGFIEWALLPQMIYGTFMIGIIPITVLGGLSLGLQERKYMNIAENINQQKSGIPGETLKDNRSLFGIPINHIKYVEALQNYVYIAHIDSEGQFKKSTERATLKHILNESSGSSIIKAHRSFLVNEGAIISITGNAQGLLLELSDSDRKIPVSRSYVSVFRGK